MLAGCLSSGPHREAGPVEPGCLLGGPPLDAPDNREPFNLTEPDLAAHPVLRNVTEPPAYTARVDCERGTALLEALAGRGADVRFVDGNAGHDVYLNWNGTTIHAVLQEVY